MDVAAHESQHIAVSVVGRSPGSPEEPPYGHPRRKETTLLALRQAASARGMTIVAEIVEVGIGAKNDRPGLFKLLAAVRRLHETDAVLCWKLRPFRPFQPRS